MTGRERELLDFIATNAQSNRLIAAAPDMLAALKAIVLADDEFRSKCQARQ